MSTAFTLLIMTEKQTRRWERSWMHRFTSKYGHRASFIWLVGIAWICMGIIVALGDQPPIDHLFHTHLPTPLRFTIWVLPASLAIAVARSRWEWTAFPLLGLPPAQRLASFWVGALYSKADNQYAPWIAWELFGRGFIYLAVLLVMWLIATWPNPVSIDLDEGFDGEVRLGDGE